MGEIMKIDFNTDDNKLTVSECYFDGIKIFKNSIQIVDIPLKAGKGFAENLPIENTDGLEYQPYNRSDETNG